MGNLRHRATRQRRSGEGGFTLIELLVVISILAVLAAVVIINVTGVKGTANTAACNTDAQTVQTAIGEYYNDHSDSYPWTSGTGLSNAMLSASLGNYLTTTNLIGSASTDACASMTVTTTNNDLIVTGTPNT
jgi:prepilin-type N-terminal cleavage/methylation domain-containing protein